MNKTKNHPKIPKQNKTQVVFNCIPLVLRRGETTTLGGSTRREEGGRDRGKGRQRWAPCRAPEPRVPRGRSKKGNPALAQGAHLKVRIS
jgi:hypothetical protein